MYNRKFIISLSLEEREGEKGEVGNMVQYLGAKQEHNDSSTPKWRTMDLNNFIIHVGSRSLVPLYVYQWIQTSYSPNYEDE